VPEREKAEELASSAGHAEAQKAAHNSAPEPAQRRVYLSMRLEEIGVDIADKAGERERLTSNLQDPSRKDAPGTKQLRQRRAYLAERLAILRKEQADLHAERKALGVASGFESGDRKKDSGRDAAKKPLIN